jgi:alanyl-tRNA synthetase
MGPAASDEGHKDCKFPCDCGRYVEIWNLVFMQYNLVEVGPFDPQLGKVFRFDRLPKPCVDTGMGLERVAAVLQGVISNYETDLFTPLIERAAQLLGRQPLADSSLRVIERTKQHMVTEAGDIQPSYRVIADHSRAATFLISDGVAPSNEGRGYVLRKIIRRAFSRGQLSIFVGRG